MTQRGGGGPAKDGVVLHELAAAVVHGVYRLVKACQFHADVTNDVITSLTVAATAGVHDYCARAETETVALSFLGDAIFVNRQILKVSRDMHALAAELGAFLQTCDVTELTFAATVTRPTMATFAKLLADVQRDRSLSARLTGGGMPGITAGKAKFAAGGSQTDESPAQRVSRTYATSVLTVRGVLADVRAGKFELPKKIKRVAQQVVARADDDARLLVALAANGSGSLDAATIAVGSAILAVAMTRQLTSERGILVNAAMTALLYDAGRVGLDGSGGGSPRTLNDDELDAAPAHTVVALTALGRMHAPARARTSLLYEAWWMRRTHRLGPLYKGRRPPSLLARIIHVARAFAELRGAGAEGGLSIDDAIQMLTQRAVDGTDRAIVKLFIGALGIYPAGTMVTLNTGELGVVLTTPADPLDYVRPSVKILYDADASLLEPPLDVDLAAPSPGQPLRFVASAVDADEQQTKAMRSYVTAAMAAKRRDGIAPGASAPLPRAVVMPAPIATIGPIGPLTAKRVSGELPITVRPAAEPTLESGGLDLSDLLGRSVSSPVALAISEAPLVTTKPPARDDLISTSPPLVEVISTSPPLVDLISTSPPVLEPIESSLPPLLEPIISTKPPATPKPPEPAPARRRDPRNDTAPPAGLVEEVLRPVPVIRRLVPLNIPLPDSAPLKVPATSTPPTPRSAPTPASPPPAVVAESWEDFDLGPPRDPILTDPAPPPVMEVEASQPPPVARPEAPPDPTRAPSFGPEEGVDAFLNDALRELSQPPPPKDPKKG